METLGFLDFVSQFESEINANFHFELLELRFTPYSFGSGLVAYNIKGKIVKIVYDGRDNLMEAKLSEKHEKYPTCAWIHIFSGNPSELMKTGIKLLKDNLS